MGSTRQALKKAFPGGWSPPKKLSRSAMDGIRELHKIDPKKFTTSVLAERFRISPEAIRRILKSKWEPEVRKGLEKERREREAKAEKAGERFLKQRWRRQGISWKDGSLEAVWSWKRPKVPIENETAINMFQR